jgi:hypothetical protein
MLSRTLSSSNTPLRILSKMSLQACSKALSTLCPDFADASTKSRPSSFAHASASSAVTSRFFKDGPFSSDSSHKSTLLPTRMQVRCGSACSRTSASQDRQLWKPDESSAVSDVDNRDSPHSALMSHHKLASSLQLPGSKTLLLPGTIRCQPYPNLVQGHLVQRYRTRRTIVYIAV